MGPLTRSESSRRVLFHAVTVTTPRPGGPRLPARRLRSLRAPPGRHDPGRRHRRQRAARGGGLAVRPEGRQGVPPVRLPRRPRLLRAGAGGRSARPPGPLAARPDLSTTGHRTPPPAVLALVPPVG